MKTTHTRAPEGTEAGHEATTGSGENRRKYGKKGQGKKFYGFKGETADLHGKVFQLQTEHDKKGQFEDTLEAIQRYVGRVYALDAATLEVLFKELKEPVVTEPPPPEGKVMMKGGDPEVTEWQRLKYLEEIKMFLKSKERMASTVVGLYNVIWGAVQQKGAKSLQGP